MLAELRIQNFAIIDHLELRFAPGLVVLTGETGAGKSIIIDAVELLLGGRAEATVIRSGEPTALAEGTFRIAQAVREPVLAILEREGLLDDPEHLVLGREVRREGRNVARVNGRTVTLALLREVGEHLVDVHGQSEHLSLLRVPAHLELLDRYAQAEPLRQAYTETYQALIRVRQELASLRQQEQERAQRADFLAFQVNEIETAALAPGEEEQLREERTRLANAEQLALRTEQAIAALDEGMGEAPAASDLLGQAVEALENLARIDASLKEIRDEAQALLEQVSDLARRLRVYRESVEFNPKRLDEVEERLDLIRTLQRKYGETIEAVLAYAERARQELEAITHAEERIEALEAEERRLLESLGEKGRALSEARRQAAERLTQAIEAELADLRMASARFGVDLRWEEDEAGVPLDGRRVAFGPRGLDRVEFLVAPNPGEGLKPLAKIASGGETSRLMLGLKGVLAAADATPTLIFDEIDQGIGGRVGAVVGEKLWWLARQHQVLCVTHLPQLAAFADQHLKVEKVVVGGRTVTRVQELHGEARQAELAQMLGSVGEPGLESAAELLRRAEEVKVAAGVG